MSNVKCSSEDGDIISVTKRICIRELILMNMLQLHRTTYNTNICGKKKNMRFIDNGNSGLGCNLSGFSKL